MSDMPVVSRSSSLDKWTCPNDRQLALRAKLGTGWSVRSAESGDMQRKHTLSSDEQEAIRGVIQRAEEMERLEKERIGKLVERFENIRQSQMGNGLTQCVLCGCVFGVITDKPNYCVDCAKAVCSRCGLEAASWIIGGPAVWLCNVCNEKRELWKKSGAWFYRLMPEYISSPTSGPASAPPGDINNEGINGRSRSESQPARSAAPRVFFNEGFDDGTGNSPYNVHTAPAPILQGTPPRSPFGLSSPAATPSRWSNCGHVRTRSVRVPMRPDSESDDENEHRKSGAKQADAKVATNKPTSTVTETPASPGRPRAETDINAKERAVVKPPGALLGRCSTVDEEPVAETAADARSRAASVVSSTTAASPSDESASATLIVTAAARPAARVLGGAAKTPPVPALIVTSTSPSHQPLRAPSDVATATASPVASAHSAPPGDSPAHRVSSSPTARPSVMSMSAVDHKLGSIDFTLLWECERRHLICHVVRAKNLKPMDRNGVADPFVKLHLIPGASKSTKMRTRTVHKSVNPEWRDTLVYQGVLGNDVSRKTLRLSVLDEDPPGFDFIGECRVPLKILQANIKQQFSAFLTPRQALDKNDDLAAHERGQVQIRLRYVTARQSLTVGVVQCQHLAAADRVPTVDAFVRIVLKPDKDRTSANMTSVKSKSLDPQFNEEFAYPIRLAELSKKMLEITVWNRDANASSDYIGGVQLGLSSKGERLQHWWSTLNEPDVVHTQWHMLSAEFVPDC